MNGARQITADEERILRAFADIGPAGVFEAAGVVNPAPAKRDGRTRETRAWTSRTIDLIRVQMEMIEAGLLRVTVDTPLTIVITPAGLAHVATGGGR